MNLFTQPSLTHEDLSIRMNYRETYILCLRDLGGGKRETDTTINIFPGGVRSTILVLIWYLNTGRHSVRDLR